jgi:hypothetical protein
VFGDFGLWGAPEPAHPDLVCSATAPLRGTRAALAMPIFVQRAKLTAIASRLHARQN